jgi:hypothetical protein
MMEPSVAVVERDAAVESLIDLHFGSSETVATRLRVDLEAAAVPLHNVVVADDAFVGEAADALEIFRSRAPGLGGGAGSAGEAAVGVGEESC